MKVETIKKRALAAHLRTNERISVVDKEEEMSRRVAVAVNAIYSQGHRLSGSSWDQIYSTNESQEYLLLSFEEFQAGKEEIFERQTSEFRSQIILWLLKKTLPGNLITEINKTFNDISPELFAELAKLMLPQDVKKTMVRHAVDLWEILSELGYPVILTWREHKIIAVALKKD